MNSYALLRELILKPCCLLVLLFQFSAALQAQATYTVDEIKGILQKEKSHMKAADLSDLSISAQYTDKQSGLTHVYVQQNYQGVPIVDAQGGLHFNAAGELAYRADHLVANVTKKIAQQQAVLSAEEAVEAALGNLGIAADKLVQKNQKSVHDIVFEQANYTAMDIPARLVYLTDRKGDLVLAWEIGLYTIDENNYWQINIDAQSGRELSRRDLVIHCQFSREGEHEHAHSEGCELVQPNGLEQMLNAASSTSTSQAFSGANFYRVYDAPVEAPTFGNRSLVAAQGDPVASPLGWHNDGILQHNITKGNNTYAYHDPGPASSGIPAIGGLPGQQPLVFDFDADLSLPPATFRDAAITNLFYWNNLIHDIFYPYGFTEAAGNFQTTNFGRGGAGNDAVLAEAQDGSGVNNANFLTLADGLPGRMQMFLWSSVPVIDGDFDNGVILHEYGHGISTRLTGGPAATCLSGDEQGGEGWSDYFGVMVTMNPSTVPGIFASGRGMGTYVVGEGTDGAGIRPARYSTDFGVNDYTYGDLNNSEISAPHGVGFIWATMLWEMTAKLVDAYGYDADIVNGNGGNNLAIQLVMTGLKLQPCGPTFVEQRDAILAADQLLYGGANKCLIWEAFAKRGLGYSAQSGTNSRGDEMQAFDMPPAYCLPTVEMTTEVNSLATNGGTMQVNINIINNAEMAISGVEVRETMPAGTSVASATDSYTTEGNDLVFSQVSVPANSTHTITVTLNVNTPSTAQMLLRDDLEANPFGWTASPGIDQFVWTTEDAFSGDYSFKAANPNNFSNLTLTWNESLSVVSGSHLRFAHRFNTEANFDGGVVEISNDDGLTWTDIGPLFVENGYNNFVAAADNPLVNGFCFGGSSGGFIHSVADLSAFAGQSLRLRYRFASDVLTAAEGWYIDDVELVNDPYTITNSASFTMANGAVSGEETDDVLILAGSSALQARPAGPSVMAGTDRNDNSALTGEQFEMSPNPTTEQLTINRTNWTEKAVALRVLDARGKLMYSASMSDQQMQVDVSNWPAGIYLVQLQGEGEMTNRKLMVE